MTVQNGKAVEGNRVNDLVTCWKNGTATYPERLELSNILTATARHIQATIRLPENYHTDDADLVSIGIVAALEAMQRWSEVRGDFLTFSYARVRGAMYDHLRSIDPLPRAVRSNLGEINSAMARLQQSYGATITTTDIQDETGLSRGEIERALTMQRLRYHESLFSSVNTTSDDTDIVMEFLPQEDERPERRMMSVDVNSLLLKLSRRDESIMRDYYLRDLSQAECAKKYRLTEARISQIRHRALERMREHWEQTVRHLPDVTQAEGHACEIRYFT